ncbi:MAG: hypothetical protein LBP76_11010 [Treponema sp.]|jgi:hypothetical protein|nr:hypothetical protein [Treponema sp.]
MSGLISKCGLDNWWKKELTKEERQTIESVFTPYTSSGEMRGILTSGDGSAFAREGTFQFLSMLLGWFKKPEYYQIICKIVKVADSLIHTEKRIINKHFYYLSKIKAYYPCRNAIPGSLDLAIKACEDQIAISKEVAKEILKGEKRYTLKSEEKMAADILEGLDDKDSPPDKYEGVTLPDGFNPVIHNDPNDYEIIPGRLYEHTGYKQLCIIREKQGNWGEVIRLASEALEQGWPGEWDKRIEKAKKKLEQGK